MQKLSCSLCNEVLLSFIHWCTVRVCIVLYFDRYSSTWQLVTGSRLSLSACLCMELVFGTERLQPELKLINVEEPFAEISAMQRREQTSE